MATQDKEIGENKIERTSERKICESNEELSDKEKEPRPKTVTKNSIVMHSSLMKF